MGCVHRYAEERGATLVLVAILLPVLIAFSALALGGSVLYGAKQDVQRATDLGALAAAANAPTVSVNDGVVRMPFNLDGSLATDPNTAPLFDDTSWYDYGCTWSKGQQFSGQRSRVFNAFGTQGTCTPTWSWENPVLASLAGCLRDATATDSCSAELRDQLDATLPLLANNSGPVDDLHTQLDALLGNVRDTAAPATALMGQAASLLFQPCLVQAPLTGACVVANPLGSTVDEIQQKLGAGAQLGVDPAMLLPAILTPRVTVDLDHWHVKPPVVPLGGKDGFDVDSTATARRVIKSAVVLPTAGIPGFNQGLCTARLADHELTPAEIATVCQSASNGFVVDPDDKLDTASDEVRNQVFPVFDAFDAAVSGPVANALADSACSRPELAAQCPNLQDPTAPEHVLQPFFADLDDATASPPAGSRPTTAQLLQYYADRGEPTWIVSGAQSVALEAIACGTTPENLCAAWNTFKHVNDLLGTTVFTPLMFVPALDATPAFVRRPVPDGPFVIEQIPPTVAGDTHDALASKGLYRARLVK